MSLDQLRTVRRIGRGSTGDILLVTDDSGAEYALKKIPERPTELRVSHLLRYGLPLQASLHAACPQVIDTHEWEQIDDVLYVKMEYVEGEDLSDVLRHGPISEKWAIDIGVQICEILEVCHKLPVSLDGQGQIGIAHGNMRPRSVRLEFGQRVRLTGFGLTPPVASDQLLINVSNGSLPYLSAERIDTGVVDATGDLWSLGIILYKMVSGALPFFDESPPDLLRMIRKGRVPQLRRGSPALARTIYRSLSPELSNRFGTARRFRQALEEVRAEFANEQRMARPKSSRPTLRTTTKKGTLTRSESARPAPTRPPLPSKAPQSEATVIGFRPAPEGTVAQSDIATSQETPLRVGFFERNQATSNLEKGTHPENAHGKPGVANQVEAAGKSEGESVVEIKLPESSLTVSVPTRRRSRANPTRPEGVRTNNPLPQGGQAVSTETLRSNIRRHPAKSDRGEWTPRPAAKATPIRALPSSPFPGGFPFPTRRITQGAAYIAIALFVVAVAGQVYAWSRISPLQNHLDVSSVDEIDQSWSHYAHLARFMTIPVGPGLGKVEDELEARLQSSAHAILESYHESIPKTRESNWREAENRLANLLRLSPDDELARAMMYYCQGHVLRIEAASLAKEQLPSEAMIRRAEAVERFERAAGLAPGFADPYLGLARIYAYDRFNLSGLEDALHEAERRGYNIGHRERAQLADAYFSKAKSMYADAKKSNDRVRRRDDRALAMTMAHRATQLYAQIPGFAQADRNKASTNLLVQQIKRMPIEP